MKRISWKLWVAMALPIAFIFAVQVILQIPPSPVQKLKDGLCVTWRSTTRPETLSFDWSSTGKYQAFLESDKVNAGHLASNFRFVDGSHILIDDDSTWLPGALIRVSIKAGGKKMLLDPSDGKNTRKSRIGFASISHFQTPTDAPSTWACRALATTPAMRCDSASEFKR